MVEKLHQSSNGNQTRRASRGSSQRSLWAVSAAAAAMLVASHVQGVTQTWDGGGIGDTSLSTATNWTNDTLPSVATPDVALWDGTVAGVLALVYNDAAFAGAAGNTGLTLSLAATQTSALSIDSGANISALRIGGGGVAVTIAAGAGAFTLGDGAGTFNITLGGAGSTTQAFTNNSSNIATINSDVVFGTGGGGAHTISFGGSGNWAINNIFTNSTGTVAIFKTGSGAATLSAANTNTGSINVTGGTLTMTGSSTAPINVGAASGVAVFNMAGNSVPAGSNNGSHIISPAAGQAGVFNQTGGTGTITGSIFVGNALSSTTTYGLYNMSGGSIVQTGSNRFRIGQSGGNGTVSMFNLNGGVITTSLGVALNDTAGTTAGLGGHAALYVASGSLTSSTTGTGLGIGGRAGQSVATIGGTGNVTLSGATILGASVAGTPAAGDAGRVAILNIGNGSSGGQLQTTSVSQNATAGALPVGYLNFNGGTLKARTTNTAFISGVTQATVQAGGGTIDNNGVTITIPQVITSVSGNALTSVGVSGATGYSGAPYVSITGGGATVPATAVANLDGSGNVTSITITNSGSGYTSAPTIALVGGGGTAGTLTPAISAVTPGALNFTGSGTTILSGNNTHTGAINVNAGAVQVSTGNSGAGQINVNSSGVLAISRAAAAGSFNQNGSLNVAGGVLKFDLGAFGNPTGPVLNVGSLTSSGTGTINISAANLSVGSFTLIDYSGTLGGTFALGTVGRIIGSLVDTGSTLDLNITGFNPNTKWKGNVSGDWDLDTTANWIFASDSSATTYKQGDVITFDDTASNFAVNLTALEFQPGGITVNNTNNAYTFSGAGSISGSTGLTKSGTSRLTIANDGANTFTGTVTINAGTLQVGNGATGGSLGTGTVMVNNGVLHYNHNGVNPNITQSISGTGSLIIESGANGTGLSGNNTYDGTTQILSGTVFPNTNTAFGSAVAGTTLESSTQIYATAANLDFGTESFVLNSAQLHTGGNKTITFGGPVTLTGASTFNADGGSTGNITGTLTASGDVNKTGVGVFILAGVSTFSAANVSAGTLVIANNATYGASTLNGGVLQVGNGGTLGNLGSGFVDNLGAVAYNRSDAVTVPAGLIIGAGSFIQNGVGTTTLAGDNGFMSGSINSFNGMLILEDGTLGTTVLTTDVTGSMRVKSKNPLTSVTTVNIAADNSQTGALEISNSLSDVFAGATVNFSARQPTNLTPGLISLDGNNSFAGNILLNTGGSEYIIQSNAGATLDMKGTLQCVSTITGSLRQVRLSGDGIGTFSGVISTGGGTGTQTVSINKTGAGTWTLNAANAYNGDTIATAGTLVLKGDAKKPVTDSGRFGTTNGGALVLDYNDTGVSPASDFVADLTTNEATNFIGGTRIRTTQTANAANSIGWKDDTSGKQLTLRYTHKGDINLDGLVDSTDFNVFALNYGKTSGATWSQGNFDYNDGGKVNTVDFNYLAGNFGLAAIGAALPGDLPGAAPSLGAVVPEPTSLGLLVAASMGMMARRRRSVR